MNENGELEADPVVYNPNETEEENQMPFDYAVLHIYVKNNECNSNVEFMDKISAIQNYFTTLAADIDDEEVKYTLCAVIEPSGYTKLFQAF